MMQLEWQQRFLRLAHEVAGWSKDPSTKVGCVLVNDLRQVVGLGYNGFPRGVPDHPGWLDTREVKYRMTVHAEVNAVLQATASTRGASAFVTHAPCSNCTGVLIQAGIKAIYTTAPDPGLRERFSESFEAAGVMLDKAGVEQHVLPVPVDCCSTQTHPEFKVNLKPIFWSRRSFDGKPPFELWTGITSYPGPDYDLCRCLETGDYALSCSGVRVGEVTSSKEEIYTLAHRDYARRFAEWLTEVRGPKTPPKIEHPGDAPPPDEPEDPAAGFDL